MSVNSLFPISLHPTNVSATTSSAHMKWSEIIKLMYNNCPHLNITFSVHCTYFGSIWLSIELTFDWKNSTGQPVHLYYCRTFQWDLFQQWALLLGILLTRKIRVPKSQISSYFLSFHLHERGLLFCDEVRQMGIGGGRDKTTENALG